MGGKVRIWKQSRKLEINSELKSAGLPPSACRRRRPNGRFSHWELMQTSLRFRLSRSPVDDAPKIKKRRKTRKLHSRQQQSSNWGRGLHPRHASRLAATEQHTRVKQIHFVLCKRTLSPARLVLEETSHQTRPKIDAGDASLLMGSIN